MAQENVRAKVYRALELQRRERPLERKFTEL